MQAPEAHTPRLDASFFMGPQGWPYLLVPFIPIAIALDVANASDVLIFISSALGITPTAALTGRATESSQAAQARGSEDC
jgi:Ca2+:H+ antiporter